MNAQMMMMINADELLEYMTCAKFILDDYYKLLCEKKGHEEDKAFTEVMQKETEKYLKCLGQHKAMKG